jgi:hypothetical protein
MCTPLPSLYALHAQPILTMFCRRIIDK